MWPTFCMYISTRTWTVHREDRYHFTIIRETLQCSRAYKLTTRGNFDTGFRERSVPQNFRKQVSPPFCNLGHWWHLQDEGHDLFGTAYYAYLPPLAWGRTVYSFSLESYPYQRQRRSGAQLAVSFVTIIFPTIPPPATPYHSLRPLQRKYIWWFRSNRTLWRPSILYQRHRNFEIFLTWGI